MSEHTLNIPQLVVILILTALVARWYFGRSSTSAGGSNGTRQGSRQSGRTRINPVHVDQLLQMFPQFDRRQIMWDLHHNGGNVQATTERVLSGRGLETPPPTFQPLAPTPLSGTPTTGSRTGTPVPPKPQHPDLIARYNLASKISASDDDNDSTASEGKSASKPGWSQSKVERQRLLQKRREEMILAARKKLMEKDKAKAAGAAS